MRKLNEIDPAVLWQEYPEMLENKDVYHRYLTRLLILGKIEGEDYNRELGKYFGYPRCCVENFISINKAGYAAAEVMDEFFQKDFPNTPQLFWGCGYVQCPICRVSLFFSNPLKKLTAPHDARKRTFQA